MLTVSTTSLLLLTFVFIALGILIGYTTADIEHSKEDFNRGYYQGQTEYLKNYNDVHDRLVEYTTPSTPSPREYDGLRQLTDGN